MTIAIYPGSFDPVTLGHIDIVTRASQLYDKVVMAVVKNPSKAHRFTPEERVELIEQCTSELNNIEVIAFDGLTVELARRHDAKVIIRGLRAVSDFEFEFMMSQMNKNLAPDLETVFLTAGIEYQFLTSSMVKEVANLGGDVSKVVPAPVLKKLNAPKKLSK